MNHRIFWILIALFQTGLAISQGSSQVDSLRSLPDDSTKVILLTDLAYSLRRSSPEQTIQLGKEGVDISKKLDFSKGLIQSFKQIGLGHYYLYNYDSAITFYLMGIQVARETNDQLSQASLYNNIGIVYYKTKAYELAEKNFSTSLELSGELQDIPLKAKTYGNLGNLMNTMGNMDKALEYYEKSLQLDQELGNERGISITSTNLANIYSQRGNNQKAIALNQKAIAIDLELKDYYGVTYSLGNLGNIYRKMRKYDSALLFYQSFLEIIDSVGLENRKPTAYKRMATIYSDLKDYEQAYHWQIRYQDLQDSLNEKINQQKVAEVQEKYNEELNLKEIELLKSENQLANTQITNKNLQRAVLLIILIALAGGLVLIWFQLRSSRSKSKALEETKLMAEQNNQELRMTLKALQKTQRHLIESEKMASIGALTAGLAHELNNPLNVIGGMIEPIKKDINDLLTANGMNPSTQKENLNEIMGLLDHMSHSAVKATSIIKSLIDISPKGSPDSSSQIYLCQILKNTSSIIQKQFPSVTMEMDLAEDLIMQGNSDELNQALINVLKNAMEATSETSDPRVLVSLSRQQSSALITIKDNGIGIKQENMIHIYEPFFTTKDPGEGTGLGLYISRSIIDKYLGSIAIESERHTGTTVSIRLPLISNQ